MNFTDLLDVKMWCEFAFIIKRGDVLVKCLYHQDQRLNNIQQHRINHSCLERAAWKRHRSQKKQIHFKLVGKTQYWRKACFILSKKTTLLLHLYCQLFHICRYECYKQAFIFREPRGSTPSKRPQLQEAPEWDAYYITATPTVWFQLCCM